MFPWFSEVSIHYHGLARLSAITDNKAGVPEACGSQGTQLSASRRKYFAHHRQEVEGGWWAGTTFETLVLRSFQDALGSVTSKLHGGFLLSDKWSGAFMENDFSSR